MSNLPPCCIPTENASPAERAYCAYNAAGDPATAGLNYKGEPCPTWAELPENVRAKWGAAVSALVAVALCGLGKEAKQQGVGLSFGSALSLVKAGLRVRRAAWNGKDDAAPPEAYVDRRNFGAWADAYAPDAPGCFDRALDAGDLLANDWQIVGEAE